MKKIVLIVGSLRKDSFNRQLAKEIRAMINQRAEVTLLEYKDVPFMNEDIEFPAPSSVQRVRLMIQESDALWMITPEYNYQIPGVLKNLLDWLSRPLIKRDWKTGSVMKGKKVTISGVAGKSAAIGARTSLKALLEIMSMNVVGDLGTGFVLDSAAFSTGKLELDEQSKEKLELQIETLLEII